MAKENRNKLKKKLQSLEMDSSVSGFIETLQDLTKQYGKDGFFDLYIGLEETYDYGGSYHEVILYGYRLEYDEEYNKRIAINKKQKSSARKAAETRAKKKEEKDVEEYKRLREKFEGKTD